MSKSFLLTRIPKLPTLSCVCLPTEKVTVWIKPLDMSAEHLQHLPYSNKLTLGGVGIYLSALVTYTITRHKTNWILRILCARRAFCSCVFSLQMSIV